eukprot:scaffold135244_cov84-Phaeocystis_antarctica.AAC.2
MGRPVRAAFKLRVGRDGSPAATLSSDHPTTAGRVGRHASGESRMLPAPDVGRRGLRGAPPATGPAPTPAPAPASAVASAPVSSVGCSVGCSGVSALAPSAALGGGDGGGGVDRGVKLAASTTSELWPPRSVGGSVRCEVSAATA